jgi:hypothetical protein
MAPNMNFITATKTAAISHEENRWIKQELISHTIISDPYQLPLLSSNFIHQLYLQLLMASSL